MAQKAVQNLVTQLSAISPGILVRVGSRGVNDVSRLGRILKPKFSNFAKNASVECAPPSPGEFVQEVNILKNNLVSGKSMARLSEMTVNEAAAKGLVVAEVAFWFYIGEVIGRRSIIGYNPKV